MADHTAQSIVISADPDVIMAVIADFDHYPDWVSAAREARIIETRPDGRAAKVQFELDAGVLKDTYVLEYDWAEDGLSVGWDLVSSDLQQQQRGRYTLVAQAPGSTKVAYELMVDLRVPVIGQLKRRAEKAIISSALHELKKRVEG
ncbi:MAG TPA: SRPBCC family protein [Gordonia sp. (in: high G+C Gram-positive bacteria)]|uniref:SRPBCC family protein n=1 Tax=unclassified Gordonia (in: high G+C Gram-positive bacteria) TaxID=2657482 RepID=UPI000FBD97A3|nr:MULTISPECIES: SRPBCC family protein [unclassified Gordonia (in: high G+C Gram-positive bacteria)]RUP38256.1 MAG: SRPBCC family protein [Gordonia sp. (in: high G+C Gram-positive bacteria)]HNP58307.1 SRPBCC family protein [Gordonia sp. (in: high G+C Gram-positive bacteria)]HRC51130.1 SRPBCC family protein [Gordonia sp. (in: high G+C Gram-positive bacteria)]